MVDWSEMVIINASIPIIMIICGRWLWKSVPRKIRVWSGYRTKLSMKNMETWTYANTFMGKLWWYFGWLMLIGNSCLFHSLLWIGYSGNTIG